MIHDKDYIIRIVKQFSEFLSKMILGGKNEGELSEWDRIFDTNMNDTFKMSFETLASKSSDEIINLINEKDKAHREGWALWRLGRAQVLLQLGFLVRHVLAGFRIVLGDFQLFRRGALVLCSGVKVTGTSARFELDLFTSAFGHDVLLEFGKRLRLRRGRAGQRERSRCPSCR